MGAVPQRDRADHARINRHAAKQSRARVTEALNLLRILMR